MQETIVQYCRPQKIQLVTLGCSKNLVDSEKLMRQLEANGYKVTHDSPNPQGEIAVINTCGFIGDAKEESINVLLEMAELRKSGQLKVLVAAGCLAQRYKEEIQTEIPEVEEVQAPVEAGQPLAQVKIYAGDKEICSYDLTAAESVEELNFGKCLQLLWRAAASMGGNVEKQVGL